MRVTDHAVDMYIRRIMGMCFRTACKSARDVALDEILYAYNDPDEIRQQTEYDCPIYIKGKVAIPVKEEGFIPTTYHSSTFEEKTVNGAA